MGAKEVDEEVVEGRVKILTGYLNYFLEVEARDADGPGFVTPKTSG